MLGIFANTFRNATRTNTSWDAPDHWHNYDHRTRKERQRDEAERRRMLRLTGLM